MDREQEIEALAREIAADRGVTLAAARTAARRELRRLARVARDWHDAALADYAAGWDAESATRRRGARG